MAFTDSPAPARPRALSNAFFLPNDLEIDVVRFSSLLKKAIVAFSTRFAAAPVLGSLQKSNTGVFDFRCGTSPWRSAVRFSTNY